ncbi:hypothetical protein [Streptomyces sp. NPDC093149]|uniref:hypothetical protein n=1 Tax=Streptomyces sp. NPDC093149 TaxID=3366031 RepID=UPI003811EFF6
MVAVGRVPDRGPLVGFPGAVLVGERQQQGGLRYVDSVDTGWSDGERQGTTVLARLLRAAEIDALAREEPALMIDRLWWTVDHVGSVAG